MFNPAWVEATAEAFWAQASGPPAFPRELEPAILSTQPLAIVSLPRLRPATVDAWLARHGAVPALHGVDGRLHACLIAVSGHGIIFLEGADMPDERRFSLAHELAHFLVDYVRPRTRSIEALGPGIEAVLDGYRQPTIHERVHAALAGTPLGVHHHLLAYDEPAIAAQEHAADQLAVELLAPAEVALGLARSGMRARYADRLSMLTIELAGYFGLPQSVAGGYAARLLGHIGAGPTFMEWLGVSNFGPSGGTSR